jgi:Zn-dependent M32 family carboxypeptidase
MAGRMLVELIERSSKKVAKAIASTPGWRNARRTKHTQALEKVMQEAIDLRRTLLKVRSLVKEEYKCRPLAKCRNSHLY